jgi:hypothetical protein
VADPSTETLANRLRRVLVQYERAMHELGWTMADVKAREHLDTLEARARRTDEAEQACEEALRRVLDEKAAREAAERDKAYWERRWDAEQDAKEAAERERDHQRERANANLATAQRIEARARATLAEDGLGRDEHAGTFEGEAPA